jgi:tetratricopeptide (TPR) repeat protein
MSFINVPGSYYERIMQGRDHMNRKEWEQAAAIYERLVERLSRLPAGRRQPGSDLATFLVGAALDLQEVRVEQGDYEAATQLCRQLQEWDPEDAGFWERRVFRLRIQMGEIDQGLAGLQSLADSDPDNFDHWLALAREALDTRRFELAESALEQAAALAPDSDNEEAPILVNLYRFDLHRFQGQYEEAEAAWLAAVDLEENLLDSQELVVRMFLEAGVLDEAQEYLDDGVLEEPTADFYRAIIAYRRGDRVRARHFWRRVIETTSENRLGDMATRAMAHCWLGDPIQALAILLRDARASQDVGYHQAIALALAWAMQGDVAHARGNLVLAQESIAYGRILVPLDRLDWYSFEALVDDEAVKEVLRPFFDLESPAD